MDPQLAGTLVLVHITLNLWDSSKSDLWLAKQLPCNYNPPSFSNPEGPLRVAAIKNSLAVPERTDARLGSKPLSYCFDGVLPSGVWKREREFEKAVATDSPGHCFAEVRALGILYFYRVMKA